MQRVEGRREIQKPHPWKNKSQGCATRLSDADEPCSWLLLAVGDPDVFDLGGVLEEEAVGGGGGVEPVDVAAFVGEDLFYVADGEGFGGGAGGGVGEAPEG